MVSAMINYINYLLTVIGLGMIIVSLFLIASDKIRGENVYYDLFMKEQEIKKTIDDADEMIAELLYTSETVINNIEKCISNTDQFLYNVENKTDKPDVNCGHEETMVKETSITIKTKKEKDILNLYNDGMKIDDIAKNLQIGKGEVTLVLSLNSGVKKNENI